MINGGRNAAVFQVRSASVAQPPRTYTVKSATQLSGTWSSALAGLESYDLSVYGPNGFHRAYKGGLLAAVSANLRGTLTYDLGRGGVTLNLLNEGTGVCEVVVADRYSDEAFTKKLKPGAGFGQFFALAQSHGWYDLIVTVTEDVLLRQQYAGHLETGRPSRTDPAIAAD